MICLGLGVELIGKICIELYFVKSYIIYLLSYSI